MQSSLPTNSLKNIASRRNSHFVSEMLRRLMVALASQNEATNELTKRMNSLNAWLPWFTIAIFALTAVPGMIGLGILRPIR